MLAKRSVTTSIARTLFFIVGLSILSTGLALVTIYSSLNDAEAINISGSLRMQSYRLAYGITTHSDNLDAHLKQYEESLHAPALEKLNRFYVPTDVQLKYQTLIKTWDELSTYILQGNKQRYLNGITGYVNQIDEFVFALQRNSEKKLAIVASVAFAGFIIIITLALFSIRFIRRQVVLPLKRLVSASLSIQNGDFSDQNLDVNSLNEMGVLSRAMTRMTGELSKLYRSLEDKVAEKTERLTQANHTLSILYDCSQTLNVSQIDRKCFEQVLSIVSHSENLSCLQLEVRDSGNWLLSQGTPSLDKEWHHLMLGQDGRPLGQLSWQNGDIMPHPQLMQNVANMLIRGINFNRAQKHHLQWLLMEERATIARELHDSLAQSLSFLRIQLTLLKRALPTELSDVQTIISDFDRALSDAYQQLRELLATFRLSIQEADLNEALIELIKPLQLQTSANIELDCRLSSQSLNAQQQVHALQIVREALINAIKHADAKRITIRCNYTENGDNMIEIADDGRGITTLNEPDGHYGLNIMSERASCLNGSLDIERTTECGTAVRLIFPH